MNPLVELQKHGQSFWLDNIRRGILTNGELKKMFESDGLRGMTSNPTIFEKAISSGSEYDADLKKFALKGLTNEQIFEELAISDIQKAADILRPVYKSSRGTDGYVSLEVNPNLAGDTDGTIADALRLHKRVKRPNLMIKVPATPAGLPAIQKLISLGVSVNVTLLFSVDVYKQVVNAYLNGLNERVRKGLPVKDIASVASFFVSRVDTIVDKQLDPKAASGNQEAAALLHKSAIANAKMSYAYYLAVFKSEGFEKLRKKGAQTQRLLWASTGTKDKRLSDVIYVNELIGPDTVNTMPPATIDAFRDHGKIEDKLLVGLSDAESVIAAVKRMGINFDAAMLQLQEEGVKSFSGSFDSLMRVIGAKRELLTGAMNATLSLHLGSHQASYESALAKIEKEKWVARAWAKDATVWKSDAEHTKIISNSLGWLNVMSTVTARDKQLRDIVSDIQKAKFSHVLLLGMGGSSLCPEVLRLTFGKKTGYPDFAILDSTEPASVAQRAAWSKPEKTLYIVASKSGSTTEPNAFFAYFFDQVKKKKGKKAGDHFIAITDPGTQMERIARDNKFRHIVLNPSDIGGRYSAMSFFGMLPAAIMGAPQRELVESASQMADACSASLPITKNPGARLGAALGSLANAGRDKVTFFISKDLSTFSTWVEQLIAESTGKEGKGIVPVESEPLESPATYGNDRVFVSIATKTDKALSKKLGELKAAGHPVIEISVKNKSDIAGEFFRWEFATAIAGGVMEINPFDQPNVQESKDLTKMYLDEFKKNGELPTQEVLLKDDGISVYSANDFLRGVSSLEGVVQTLLGTIRPGDYLAILAYVERNPVHEKILQSIRAALLESKKVATSIGFGPRFLHSTGQLHKGGANNGVFIQITASDPKDLPIPGEPYTFSTLKEAQALGDLTALQNRHRRAVRFHLDSSKSGFAKLQRLLGLKA